MLRRLAPAWTLALLAALVVGCGGAPQRVASWSVPVPYLPPPDPSLLDAAGDEPRAEDRSAPADTAPGDAPAAGAPTDAEIQAQLREAYGDDAGADVDRATIDHRGLATIPATAPHKLVALMQAANGVARKPYVYGGGHFRSPDTRHRWEDSAYDCSGSISYALASAGFLDGPMASTGFMTWGKPGPGKWVTVYANAGHAFMVVAGLRFDTSGRRETGTRWQATSGRSYAGFTVRHPPGL